MKLKTLKDLEKDTMEMDDARDSIVESRILKAEALKWIKEINNKDEWNRDIFTFIHESGYSIDEEGAYYVIEFIKHFFNIEDCDLVSPKKDEVD